MLLKNILFWSLLLPLFSFAQTILIDPGHGGIEVGAISKLSNGQRVFEKDLTLKFAKILKKKLSSRYKIFLTRAEDREVSLQKRAEIADEVKADLYLSLHFNSSPYKNARGAETYYLDNHDNAAVKKVEAAENSVFNVDDMVVNKILIDLAVQLTSKTSKELASIVHQNIINKVAKKHKIKDRGYKAGLLYVLALSKRPGLLFEIGFMSNSLELKKIQGTDYLNDYADGVVKGINEYFKIKRK
ncbi:MAG: N-acetylmuramoyl-L-alanine amidase [Halobacteriovoraceae bacterium]|nr:N-acetylmuramoyl-L-alanine amidase [Halobacteriovoraceae bacterium]MCB9094210.1 N-acetylmuramoyl-L-alanine amidase [Halobacteriovoraceae bacterium]